MVKIRTFVVTALFLSILTLGCRENSSTIFYGNFEVEQLNIASGGSGKIVAQLFYEGERCDSGATLFIIDTSLLSLTKERLFASIEALRASIPDAVSRLNSIEQRKIGFERELERVKKLIDGGSVSKKMAEPIEDKIAIVRGEMAAIKRELENSENSILAQIESLKAELAIIEKRIDNCYIISPANGIVLSIYAKRHEYVAEGMPLAAIAPVGKVNFNAWVSGNYLYAFSVGDSLTLYADRPRGGRAPYRGRVINIAEKGEFLPSMVQSRESRSLQHYRVKIELDSDGSIKGGMPGEVVLE